MQRVEQPVMTTGLERIAAKAREDRKLKFTSLAHHVTEELVWESVNHIPNNSAPGCDGQTVEDAKRRILIQFCAPSGNGTYLSRSGVSARG